MRPVQRQSRLIRSRDILDGEITARAMGDVLSEDFDGDRFDPEQDPGNSGWAIFRNGLAIFNRVIVRADRLAVDGVEQTPTVTTGGTDSTSNVTLGTGSTLVGEVRMPIPEWATRLWVVAFSANSITNTSGSPYALTVLLTIYIDGVAATTVDIASATVPAGALAGVTPTRLAGLPDPISGVPLGEELLVQTTALLSSGSNATNSNRLNVLVVADRT